MWAHSLQLQFESHHQFATIKFFPTSVWTAVFHRSSCQLLDFKAPIAKCIIPPLPLFNFTPILLVISLPMNLYPSQCRVQPSIWHMFTTLPDPPITVWSWWFAPKFSRPFLPGEWNDDEYSAPVWYLAGSFWMGWGGWRLWLRGPIEGGLPIIYCCS